MLNKKKLIIFILFFLLNFVFFAETKASDILTKANNISAKSLKLANIFLSWEINDEDVINLAKWDLIILDMEHQFNNPDKIKKIRELNPDVIILAYISSQEIRNDVYLYNYLHLRKEMLETIPEEWYLKYDNKKVSFWPQTWMLNSSNLGKNLNGRRWNDYLPEFVSSRVIASGLWDGVFYDNFFDTVDWINGENIDLDDDSFKDDNQKANFAWQEGNIKILQKTRELIGYDYIILINSSSFEPYQKYINGRVFEDFPISFKGDGSWQANIDSYRSIYNLNINPKFYIFNLTNNDFSDFSKMRYGLASSLMFDNVYFSFDASVKDHGQTWIYDEYNLDFSYPKSNVYQVQINNSVLWRRDFRYFSVLLNPNDYSLEIDLLKNEKKIYGWESDKKLILEANSSVIVEPNLELYGVWLNKIPYQGFNFFGKKVYTSYIVSNNDLAEKITVDYQKDEFFILDKAPENHREYKIDSNNNGFKERVEGSVLGEKSLVKIYNEQNKLVGIFRAFPDQFKCGVRIAVGDVDGDNQAEIVSMPFWGGPHVRVFDFSGKLKYEFFAGDKKTRAFYDLNLEDIDLDGRTKEILIATY